MTFLRELGTIVFVIRVDCGGNCLVSFMEQKRRALFFSPPYTSGVDYFRVVSRNCGERHHPCTQGCVIVRKVAPEPAQVLTKRTLAD